MTTPLPRKLLRALRRRLSYQRTEVISRAETYPGLPVSTDSECMPEETTDASARSSSFGNLNPFSYTVIYGYTIPDGSHQGLIKVGDTQFESDVPREYLPMDVVEAKAKARIRQQLNTAGVKYDLQFAIPVLNDPENVFRDHRIHELFKRNDHPHVTFEHSTSREWFQLSPEAAKESILGYLRGEYSVPQEPVQIQLREEQQQFVDNALAAWERGDDKRLWNAKMRFGKTITAYAFVKKAMVSAKPIRRVLVVTHRPITVDAWFKDYRRMFTDDPNMQFVSETLGRHWSDADMSKPITCFFSTQDLRGKDLDAGSDEFKRKNREIFETDWDLVIVDEAHEGNETALAQAMHDGLKRTFTLYLSGTPFKYLSDDTFAADQIDTWDYSDEQAKKAAWDANVGSNPYAGLARLNIYALDIRSDLKKKFRTKEEGDAAFDFATFWAVDKKSGEFVNVEDIKQFLRSIQESKGRRGYMPYGAERVELIRHTLWVLPSTYATKALKALLADDAFFQDYTVINVAGQEDKDAQKPLDAVRKAIGENSFATKTITLTVGRLTTGVTVEPWTGVLMLRNTTSAEFYMQTIFRVQSPFYFDGQMKTECFVWDFAPDRVLQVLKEVSGVATRPGTSSTGEQQARLRRLLNYMPVIADTGADDLKTLDAQEVVYQLKKVFRERVVDNGFDSSLLFRRHLGGLTPEQRSAVQLVHLANGKYVPDVRQKPDTKVTISSNGLDQPKRELEENESRLAAISSQQRTPAEEAELAVVRQELKERQTILAVLKTISVRIPYMIIALMGDEDFRHELGQGRFSIESFVERLDDESWREFFVGISKETFLKVAPIFDADVLQSSIQAWIEDVERALRLFDEKDVSPYEEGLEALLGKLRNPNKETVLTPYRVVEMIYEQAGLGRNSEQWITFVKEYARGGELPTFYDINAKTGLFPLFAGLRLAEAATKSYVDLPWPVITSHLYANSRTMAAAWFSETVMNKPAHFIERDGKKVRHLWDNLSVVDVTLLLERIEDWNELPSTARPANWVKVADPYALSATAIRVANAGFMLKQGQAGVARRSSGVQRLLAEILADADRADQVGKLVRIMAQDQNGVDTSVPKFDFTVSNPPYQLASTAANTRAQSIYPKFVVMGSLMSNTSIMIHPARAFTGQGSHFVSKEETEAVTQNPEFAAIWRSPSSAEVFPTADIKGGLLITKYQEGSSTVSNFSSGHLPPEAEAILLKVASKMTDSLSGHFSYSARFTPKALQDQKEVLSRLSVADMLRTNVFEVAPELFSDSSLSKTAETIVLGRIKGQRTQKWIRADWVSHPAYGKWKVFLPKANGSGLLGEELATPVMGTPVMVATQTFIALGSFDTEAEAEGLLKYVKTRFARLMLGTLKTTQDNPPKTWANVPWQNFAPKSDIDWAKSVDEIDEQLFQKYSLSTAEVEWVRGKILKME